MYDIEKYVPVQLCFPAMPDPIEVFLTWRELYELDTRFRRTMLPDGTILYGHPDRSGAGAACARIGMVADRCIVAPRELCRR